MKVVVENEDGERETLFGVSDFEMGDGCITVFWPSDAPIEQEEQIEGDLVGAVDSSSYNLPGIIDVMGDSDSVRVVIAPDAYHLRDAIREVEADERFTTDHIDVVEPDYAHP